MAQIIETTSAPASTSARAVSSTQPGGTTVPQTSTVQLVMSTLAPSSPTTTFSRSSTSSSTSVSTDTESQSLSVLSTVTRPIITPSSTATSGPTTEIVAANSHLSFGAIVGVVAAVILLIGVTGTCLILGPRRALRKIGINSRRDEETIDYEEWEQEHRDSTSGVWGGRPASVGANSDWWRPPPGAFPTRQSTISMAGPGMAGVGAGKVMEVTDMGPPPRRISQRQVEERRAVRSGWFASSMVRGASLLSLGSLVRPPTESSSGAEKMDRLGTRGSAGRRFQELYRRERAQQQGPSETGTGPRARVPPVSEMGERQMGERRSRVMTPKTRRPSRLAQSYVPEIVVHDATHPSLSSVSNESGGRGYDADAEVEPRRARVF